MAIFSKKVTNIQRRMQNNGANDDRGHAISILSRHNHNRVSFMPSPTHPRKQRTLGDLLYDALAKTNKAWDKAAITPKKRVTLKPRKDEK
mgnify:CR=1 FL=1